MSFDELAASRREWINSVLMPWCRRAALAELKQAEFDWENIAGNVDPQATLWTWAWARFAELVHEKLSGVNETREVRVHLKDGRQFTGYPDNRHTTGGRLVLLCSAGSGTEADIPPIEIDDIAGVEAVPG